MSWGAAPSSRVMRPAQAPAGGQSYVNVVSPQDYGGTQASSQYAASMYGDAGTHSTAFYWSVLVVFTVVFLVGARVALGRRSQTAGR